MGNESMCGRFTLTRQNRREFAPRLGADEDDFRDYRPRYNIAPTDPHFIVTSKDERRTGRAATRGLVTWATDSGCAGQFISAKAERLAERCA
jgi:putative SOS response-associated peptidase YedK